MSAFWAVFLLCSLLTPSQVFGIKSLISQANLNGLLAKPGGVLDTVGNLLDTVGALGDSRGGAGGLGGLQNLLEDGLGINLLHNVPDIVENLGATAGVLGGDGGVLSGDGGVLGIALGKEGVLNTLIGKDGLVDSLLHALLNGGLLGKNGLVGNLLVGNGGDLIRAKILNNTLPRISLRSLPGFGHQVDFNTQLLVKSTSVPGSPLCVQVEADVSMLVQHQRVAPQNNKDCKIFDINISLRPNVPLLEQPLKSFLSRSLSEAACSIINARLNTVSDLTGSRPPTLPLGAVGDLPPFSIINDDAIQLDLNLLGGDVEGRGADSTQEQLTANLLLATDLPPQLSLSQQALSNLLGTVQSQGALDLNITNSMVPNSILLSTSALLPLIPQLNRILPSNLPLELRVQVPSKPVVEVSGKKATATLGATIGVFSPLLQSSGKPLFHLATDIVLSIIPSISDGKLQTVLALDSISLTQPPLSLDPRSASMVTEWVKQVLGNAYVPAINDALSVVIPLPNVFSARLRDARVDITKDADNAPDTDLKRFC